VQHLFTYGSLMFRPVWECVVAGRYAARNAVVHGYRRGRVRGEVYPGLVPGPPDSAIPGVVYLDVSDTDLARLDRFEGEGGPYYRAPLQVTFDDGDQREAWAYLFRYPDRLDDAGWDPARFAASELDLFLGSSHPPISSVDAESG
jgi:gamma-glutamylcyclotransferase (GGCT)/AIG2-like uncharacterized protein YtfP